MGYLDELFGPDDEDEEEERVRATVPDYGFASLGQGSPYTSPRPVGTAPRAPLDMPALPYGEQGRAGPDPTLALPRLPPEPARRPLALPDVPYEPPPEVDAVAGREPSPSYDFSVDEAEAAQERFGGDRPARAAGIERVYQPPRGAAGKPGQPISALGPKPDELGEAITDANRMRARRQIGGGIARIFGMGADELERSLDDADRPIEEYNLREGQRRYGVQQDAARREEGRDVAREQRLGQERTRQLDLEGQRLTQQQAAAEQVRQDRLARDATRDDFSRQRIAIAQQRADQGRRRGGGGGGGTAPGAPGEAGAMVDSPDAWRDFWMAQGHSAEQAGRSWSLMPRRQDRIDAIQGAMGPGAERQERLRVRQGARAELRRLVGAVEESLQAGAPGLGGPLNAPVGGTTGEWARGLVQGEEAQVARARLADLANIVNHRSFGANFTRSEQARAALAGLDPSSPPAVIQDRIGRLRAILDEEEADVGGDETHAPPVGGAPHPAAPRPAAPAEAPAPGGSPTHVIVQHNGRLRRIPVGRLQEATNDGAVFIRPG